MTAWRGLVAGTAADAEPDVTARAEGAQAWRLAPRSPTLDGNVPLRAARSCPPLLAGNAFGLFLSPASPIVVRRGLRSVDAPPTVLRTRAVDRHHVELEIDTGLTVTSCRPGVIWTMGRAFNRRDRRVDVLERAIEPGDRVLLTLIVALARGESIALGGELATLAPFLAGPTPAVVPLGDASALGDAFAGFFDERYFGAKRGRATNVYRDRMREGPAPTLPSDPRIVVAHAGGAPPRVGRGAAGELEVRVATELDVDLAWFGRRVEVAIDPAALRRRAATLEHALGPGFGRGASLYFTTYATAHAPGDPHVFFKPATLLSTPSDVVAVVDGPSGDGLEAMRGLVETSWFHALPAVAEVVAPRARLARKADLVRVRFAPAAPVAPTLALVRDRSV